jgi:hypothetical protein
MRYRFPVAAAAVVLVACGAPRLSAQDKAAKPPTAPRPVRAPDGHPNLDGIWAFAIDLPPTALKKQTANGVAIERVDQTSRQDASNVPGALPSTPAPAYKPEFQAKVKYLFDNESKEDPVFYCGKPGVPRIGSPRRIVQLPREMIFLYEDISGDAWRIVPTDGRPHLADANPSYYGDSVGHWKGDTLVVDVTNFAEDGWFGEGGYFHSDAMHVTERFWRVGENLAYQFTVNDPKVLAAPWTAPPRLVKPSSETLEESPKCVEADGKLLLNTDHHGQR